MTDSISKPSEITALLLRWADGDGSAISPLIELTYADLKQIARKHLRHEHAGQTLQTIDLINEAYVRMSARHKVAWESRAQFFGFASAAMRRILVDHARARLAAKRGGGHATIALHTLSDPPTSSGLDLHQFLDLHGALKRLAEHKPELEQIVVMKYFAGLSLDEIGEVLQVSRATIKRRWTLARKWLARELRAAQDLEGGR